MNFFTTIRFIDRSETPALFFLSPLQACRLIFHTHAYGSEIYGSEGPIVRSTNIFPRETSRNHKTHRY